SEQAPQRLAPCTGEEVPERDFDDPVASVVQVDRLEQLVDGVRSGRVDAEQQALDELAVGYCVSTRVALAPVVAADDDDGRDLARARFGIPRGDERRGERKGGEPAFPRRRVS